MNELRLDDDYQNGFHIIGQIGYGYIGRAVENLFMNCSSGSCFHVVTYDKLTDDDSVFDLIVANSEIIFIAVPTPMEADGRCHLGIVESVLDRIVERAAALKRPLSDFIVVVKSTIPPGSTERWKAERPGLRLVFSPEFLTEKNNLDDFMNAERLILGGDSDDCHPVARAFAETWRDRFVVNDPPVIVLTNPTQAELVKYFTNVILATVVTFANEFKLVCDALGQDYDAVKNMALLDRRISPSHLNVPGHDGQLGFGGSCFPKDVNSICHIARELGVPERLFSAVVQRNDELRPSRDWEQLKGRAVV